MPSNSPSKLSETQKHILRCMANTGLPLERRLGGIWTLKGLTIQEAKCQCLVHTIRAMERQRLLERLNTYPEDWKDDRGLTDLARSILS